MYIAWASFRNEQLVAYDVSNHREARTITWCSFDQDSNKKKSIYLISPC